MMRRLDDIQSMIRPHDGLCSDFLGVVGQDGLDTRPVMREQRRRWHESGE